MIKITVYKDSRSYTGFKSEGHAGYAEEGYDIICAAVSVLTVNTINSIESFYFRHVSCETKGWIYRVSFDHPLSSEAVLLMNSMILGLQEIEKDYGHEYIRLIFKEV